MRGYTMITHIGTPIAVGKTTYYIPSDMAQGVIAFKNGLYVNKLQFEVDEDGTKYQESSWTLHVTRDGRTLFSRSLSKADFKSQLPEDFQKLGIMDGLRFHHIEEGKLYFSTCVSYPDSDMSYPFILTIGPDGSYTIEPDTTVDDDELPPTPAQPEE